MYISKYSNGKEVSDAQYITEIICEKKAKREKKDLHYRFWLNKEWENFCSKIHNLNFTPNLKLLFSTRR